MQVEEIVHLRRDEEMDMSSESENESVPSYGSDNETGSHCPRRKKRRVEFHSKTVNQLKVSIHIHLHITRGKTFLMRTF